MSEDKGSLKMIKLVVEHTDERKQKAAHIAELIRQSQAYRWVGIYDVLPAEISAIAWTGVDTPAYPTFPIMQGLCGAAVASGRTIIAGDVSRDPRYLTTFGSTRSEMVVPIFSPKTHAVCGLIDIESERLNAFSDADRTFIEDCARAVAGLWSDQTVQP